LPRTAWDGPLRFAIDAMDARLDRSSQRPIAVAFSGGGDSLALLSATTAYARQVGRSVIALTVDHRLSPDSQGWTELARINALKLGANWRGLVWAGDKPSTGLPAAARQARHTLLADAARRAGARVVLFGHTADDVIEAMDMRAAEAPGLGIPKIWSASPVWPAGRGLALFRPLLNMRREALRAALRREGLAWIDDPANLDPRFARSRARLRLAGRSGIGLPKGEAPRPKLAAFASQALFSKWGEARVDRDALSALPHGEGLGALGALVASVSGAERPPRPERVARLLDRLTSEATVMATLSGALVFTEDRSILVMREVGDARSRRSSAPDVFDGRFETDAAEALDWLKGQMRRLDPESCVYVRNLHPRLRPSLPVWRGRDGVVHLAGRCQGKGGGGGGGPSIQSLAKARFRLACGAAQREGELDGL
jgi:tRNA(Ile)-lysidine synthase